MRMGIEIALKMLAIAAAIALAGVAVCRGEEPTPIPAVVPVPAGDIVFPRVPGVPTPAVGDIPTLNAGQFFVVTSDTPFLLLASPRGLVGVTYEAGPLRLRGVFADSISQKVETRRIDSKHIALVDCVEGQSGRVELLAIPAGVTDENDITRRLVDIGVAPQPPPGPTPPQPTPPGPAPIPAPVGLRVLLIYETEANNTREQMNVLYSPALKTWLDSHCAKGPGGRAEWRRWDPDVKVSDSESRDLRDLWTAAKPEVAKGGLPVLVIANNGSSTVHPLPATEADAIKLLEANK